MTTGTQIALLRGINVGRAKRVAMADLRALVEGLGYGDVRTLLNSGNVVFTAPAKAKGDAAARIEQSLKARLGVTSRVIVITAAELAAIVEANPLVGVAADPTRLLVTVLATNADRTRLEPFREQVKEPDVLAIGERAAYVWCATGILASQLVYTMGRVLGDAATTRNWATILKLHALASGRG